MIHKVITLDRSNGTIISNIEFKDRDSALKASNKLKDESVELSLLVCDIEYSLNDIFIQMIAANPMEKVETHWVNAQQAYKLILDNYLKEKEMLKPSKKSQNFD